MCGGGSKKQAAPAAPAGAMYAPADTSNRQRQAAAIETDSATRAMANASYGSELGTGGQ